MSILVIWSLRKVAVEGSGCRVVLEANRRRNTKEKKYKREKE